MKRMEAAWKKIKILFPVSLLWCLGFSVNAQEGCSYYDANGDHNWEPGSFAYATCIDEGYYDSVCVECGFTVHTVTYPEGHNWVMTDIVQSTCENSGFDAYECTKCLMRTYEERPLLGHSWINEAITVEPTCWQNGMVRARCENCGITQEYEIPSVDHRYGDWKITTAASDHGKGTRTCYCQYCGYNLSEEFYPEGTMGRGWSNNVEQVKEVQQMLIQLKYLNDKADGIFGKKTEQAVKDYQAAKGLNVDGILWPQTWKLLEEEQNAPSHKKQTAEPEKDSNAEKTNIEKTNTEKMPGIEKDLDEWKADIEQMYTVMKEKAADEAEVEWLEKKQAEFQRFSKTYERLWREKYASEPPKVTERMQYIYKEQYEILRYWGA